MSAAKDGLYYRDVLNDMGVRLSGPTTILSDSRSAVDMSFDPIAFRKTKHILRAAFFLRDLVARRFFTLCHIPGVDNVADLMTKAVSRPTFLHLIELLDDASRRPAGSPPHPPARARGGVAPPDAAQQQREAMGG